MVLQENPVWPKMAQAEDSSWSDAYMIERKGKERKKDGYEDRWKNSMRGETSGRGWK